MKHIAVVLVMVVCAAPVAQAQEFHRNAYGMYAAPTIYGISHGSEYELANSGAGLDLGGYYARAFTPGFSVRLEIRYGTRTLDDTEENTTLLPGAFSMFRLSEEILEMPLILNADRRILISDHELRVSVGGGGELDGPYNPIAADSYRKVGILVDGGTTFQVNRASAIFLRLRFDVDIATAGEPQDADVVRRFWAAGFYAGFEYGF
jgi:hypothetical protein